MLNSQSSCNCDHTHAVLTCTPSCTHTGILTCSHLHTHMLAFTHTCNTLHTPWAHSADISCLWEGRAEEFKVPCTKPWASQVLYYDLLFLVSLERFYTTMKTRLWRIDAIRRRVEFRSSFKPTGCILLCFWKNLFFNLTILFFFFWWKHQNNWVCRGISS